MVQMQAYGYCCGGCRHSVYLGKIELPQNAVPSQLHDSLRLQWTDRFEKCDDPDCGHLTFVRLDRTLVLPIEPTETLYQS
jgi:hypothetical protein